MLADSTPLSQTDAEILRAAALRSLLSNGKRRKIERSTTPAPEQPSDLVIPLQTPGSTSTEHVEQEVLLSPLVASSTHPDLDHEEGEIFEDEDPPIAGPSSFRQEPTTYSRSGPLASPFTTLHDALPSADRQLARPGYLDLTEAELRSCKHLILDLLGMGFSSEHLLTLGIHPALLAICFIEMHLILPPNLPLDAIPPLPPLPPGIQPPPSLTYHSSGYHPSKSHPDTPHTHPRESLDMEHASPTPNSPYQSEDKLDSMHRAASRQPSHSAEDPHSVRAQPDSPDLPFPPRPHQTSPPPTQSPMQPSLPPPPPSLPPAPVPSMPPLAQRASLPTATPHASLPQKPVDAIVALASASEAKWNTLEEPPVSVEPVDPLPRPLPAARPTTDAKEANLKLALKARKAQAAAAIGSPQLPSEQPAIPAAIAAASRLEELRLREILLKSRQKGSRTPNRIEDNQPITLADPGSSNGASALAAPVVSDTSTPNQSSLTQPEPSKPPGVATPPLHSNMLGSVNAYTAQTRGHSPANILLNANGKRPRATDLFPDEPNPQAPVPTPVATHQVVALNTPIAKTGPYRRHNLGLLQSASDTSSLRHTPVNDWVEYVIEVSSDEGGEETSDEAEDVEKAAEPQPIQSPDKRAKLDNDVLAFLNGAVFSVPASQNAQKSLPPSAPMTPKAATQSTESKSAYEKRMGDIALLKAMIAKREARKKPSLFSIASDLSTPPPITPPVYSNYTGHLPDVLDSPIMNDDEDQLMNDPESNEDHVLLQSPDSLAHSNDLPATSAVEQDDGPDGNDTLAVIGSSMNETNPMFNLLSSHSQNGKQEPQEVPGPRSQHFLNNPPSRFRLYRSPLGLLHPSSRSNGNTLPNKAVLQAGTIIDLLPLKVEAASRLNPDRRLCKFETGGGTCLDPKCYDLHIKDFQPTDEDTARFLVARMPTFQTNDVIQALQAIRDRTNNIDYSSLVSEACRTLGLR